MNNTAERLYELLPAIYRIRDAEQGHALKGLIAVIAEEVEALEENLAQSYDDHFIETCAQWVIPYIGDLIGYRTLHGVAPKIASQRAEVANTIGFRRRKGTASMLEQLARDVTSWNVRVVEFFELLATNQYLNHLRLHNTVTRDLRQWEPLERLNTAFDTIPRSVDVRRISTGEGKYNIPNIGIFLWRLKAYQLTGSPAVRVADNDHGRYMFSPLGINMPLFTNPVPEDEITHIAEPINVPDPISRRVLDARLNDYYGKGKSFFLRVDGEGIDISEIGVCDLSDVEEQRIRISGHADGQYRLSFDGQTTADIDHDAPPSDIQAALEALNNISLGDITVDGTVTDTEVDVTIHFSGTEIDSPNPLISVNVSGMNPVDETTATVEKNWAHEPLAKTAIDPVLGRIAFALNKPQRIHITGHEDGQYTIGFDGGTAIVNHNVTTNELRTVFAGLSNLPEAEVTVVGTVTKTEIDIIVAFGGVLGGTDVPTISVDDSALTPAATSTVTELNWTGSIENDVSVDFHYGFSAEIGGGEYERQRTFDRDLDIIADVTDGGAIQDALDSATESGAVQINSSSRYEEALSIGLAASQQLELRAGNEHRPTIELNGDLAITGGVNSEITLNGLLIAGATVTIPSTDNLLRKVTFRHCTLLPGLALNIDGEPLQPDVPSLVVEMENLTVVIDHCIIGTIRSDLGATIEINDSIVDATASTGIAFAALDPDEDIPGGILELQNSTVIGKVFAAAMPLVSNTIFFSELLTDENETWPAPVRVERKQTGCVRFSFVPPDSRVPRRYRCQPDLAVRDAIASVENQGSPISEVQRENITNGVQARIRPGFSDLRYGRPAYCQLRHSTPVEIRTGADDESEMGVFHQLYQPQRETNLRVRLDEYLRFGLEAGIFYAT